MRVGELMDVLLELDEDDVVLINNLHVQFVSFEPAHERGTLKRRACGCEGCPGMISEHGGPVPVPPSVTLGTTIYHRGLTDVEPPVRLYGRRWSRELKEHHRV